MGLFSIVTFMVLKVQLSISKGFKAFFFCFLAQGKLYGQISIPKSMNYSITF